MRCEVLMKNGSVCVTVSVTHVVVIRCSVAGVDVVLYFLTVCCVASLDLRERGKLMISGGVFFSLSLSLLSFVSVFVMAC